jgi:hypothetical protein
MVYFQTKKKKFLYIGLGMDTLWIFYGHFGTFKSICCRLPPFGLFCGNCPYIYFPHFGMLEQEKSGNPGFNCKIFRWQHFDRRKMVLLSLFAKRFIAVELILIFSIEILEVHIIISLSIWLGKEGIRNNIDTLTLFDTVIYINYIQHCS